MRVARLLMNDPRLIPRSVPPDISLETLDFVSSSETLLDDALRLAEKAKADGVTVDLQVWKNLPHVWPIFARQLPEAGRALRMTAEFIEGASSSGRHAESSKARTS